MDRAIFRLPVHHSSDQTNAEPLMPAAAAKEGKAPSPVETVAARLIVGVVETHGAAVMRPGPGLAEFQPVPLVPGAVFPRIHSPRLHGDRASLLDGDCR